MPINLENLVRLLQRNFAEERPKQAGREAGGIAALKEAIEQFGPGYGSGLESKAKAAATAGAIGSGLGGTTRPAAISAGLSGEFEDMRRGRMATALTSFANFLGSYRDPTAVTPSTLTHAATGGFGGMLSRDIATEQANQAVRAQNAANAAKPNPFMQSLGLRGSGGGGGGVSNIGGSIWDSTSLGGFGGGGSSAVDFGGPTDSVNTGNLLGDFDPEAANLRLGNVLQGDQIEDSVDDLGQFFRSTGLEPGKFDDQRQPAITASLSTRYSRAKRQGFTGSYKEWYYTNVNPPTV